MGSLVYEKYEVVALMADLNEDSFIPFVTSYFNTPAVMDVGEQAM